MGTEKSATKSSHRSKPPPVPPRPQHLIPVKIISKYCSMPDILNGRKRDTNPDLLKLDSQPKRIVADIIRPVCVRMPSTGAYHPPVLNYRDVRSNGNDYTMMPSRSKAVVVTPEKTNKKSYVSSCPQQQQQYVNTTKSSSKKLSCIPSRSNSKKKQKNVSQSSQMDDCYQMGQTSWYVADTPATTVRTTTGPDHYDVLPRTCRQRCQERGKVSSRVPPLPRSHSDASHLRETTNTYPLSLSPASRSLSSTSEVNNTVHPRVPPPAVPRSSSRSNQNEISAVYANSPSSDGGINATAREERLLQPPPPPPPRKPTSLDLKLSFLREEMHVLRQMDLSLLSQLWSLNESIHEFRRKQELLSSSSAYLVNSSDEEDSGCYHWNMSSHQTAAAASTPNHYHNTSGSSSSRSSNKTASRSTLGDVTKP